MLNLGFRERALWLALRHWLSLSWILTDLTLRRLEINTTWVGTIRCYTSFCECVFLASWLFYFSSFSKNVRAVVSYFFKMTFVSLGYFWEVLYLQLCSIIDDACTQKSQWTGRSDLRPSSLDSQCSLMFPAAAADFSQILPRATAEKSLSGSSRSFRLIAFKTEFDRLKNVARLSTGILLCQRQTPNLKWLRSYWPF